MTESNESPAFVEQALIALRDAPSPEGPPAHLLKATAARLQSLETSANAHPGCPARPAPSRFGQLGLARYGGLMAACAAGIAALAWVGLIDHSATLAFADVQE